MKSTLNAFALGLGLIGLVGCHATPSSAASEPELVVAQADSEPPAETATEESDGPIQGIISLDDLKKLDPDAQPDDQDDTSSAAPPDDGSDTGASDTGTDTSDAAPSADDAVCYYDDDNNPVTVSQVIEACRVHFEDDAEGFDTCVSDHCGGKS